MKKLFILLFATLVLASCADKGVADVRYSIWLDWPERYLPDFSTLGEPDMQGVKKNIDFTGLPDTLNHFAVLLETELDVAADEEYTFTVTTDDGSKFYIDSELLIVNDGAHGPITKEVTKQLSKGEHALRLEFFDYDKGQSIYLTYSTPTIAKRQFDESPKLMEKQQAMKSDFVKPQVDEAVKRYREWKGNDETLVFPMVTDVHTAGRFSYYHVGYAAEVAKGFDADFMVNFGDIGLNAFPATEDSLYAQSIVDNIREQMLKYDGIWLYTPGNHDFDGGQGRLFSEGYLSETFQKPWQERAGENLHLVPGRTLGYYDIPEKGIRAVILNSQGTGTREGRYYYFDDAQIEWVKGVLADTPENLSVLFLAHYTPVKIGRWKTFAQHPELYLLDNDEKIKDVIADYAKDRKVVGFFTGDSHCNFHIEEKGVDYYTSQGYGWATPDLLLDGTRRAYFDYVDNLCIDVVCVKPALGEVHTFRVGAGGADFDYSFVY